MRLLFRRGVNGRNLGASLASRDTPRRPHDEKSWLIWLVVTVVMMLYVWAGSVASKSEKIGIKLEGGYSAQVPVFRLAEDRLRMELMFKGDHTRRPELGTWSSRSNWREDGILKFDNPGAAIRMVASLPGATAVTYEAMPTTASGQGRVVRNLTASLSTATGVWRWPAVINGLVLHRGMNIVNIEVVAVEPPLVGEDIELVVLPVLGFKVTMPSVGLLWFLVPVANPLDHPGGVGCCARCVGVEDQAPDTSEGRSHFGGGFGTIASQWWATSFRTDGRDHLGMVGGITSESRAASFWKQHQAHRR